MTGIRFLFFLVCLMGFSAVGNAQESAKKTTAPAGSGLKLPDVAVPSAPSSVLEKPSDLFNKPMPSSGSILQKENNWNFSKPKTFTNSGQRYEDKLNKSSLTGEMLFADSNHNQYLGDIKAHSGSVRLYYRDDGSVDGDKVKITVNDKVVKESLTLAGDFQGFTIELQDGFNKIEFQALNEGTDAPNTAEFQIFDEKGIMIHSSNWQLSAGYTASVIVVK